MSANNPEIARIGAALASQRLTINRLEDGSGVVLDVQREQLVSMNRTGLMIIQAIADGAGAEADIAEQISQSFGIDLDRAQQDVRRFARQLAAAL